jgi:D-alanyl-D-alanine carboxypeptidase
MIARSATALLRSFMCVLALAFAAAGPALAEKYAAIVVDLDTSEVLHARNADDPRYPASLTKVMTLYLVFDALDSGELRLNERMKVSTNAQRAAPSRLGLKSGATIRVEDAIRGLVTKSANDAAVVIAERLAGSEKAFASRMNRKAKELGLENTVFVNASGLPDNRQITTARDMAKLAEAVLMDHRDRYTYFSTRRFTYNKRTYKNHNTLLGAIEGVDGIKTGYTNASGYNLMASAERSGRRVVAVMMGGSSGSSRDAHVADLIEAAFQALQGTEGFTREQLLARISEGERFLTTADELAAAQLRKYLATDEGSDLPTITYTTEEGAGEDESAPESGEGDTDSSGEDVADTSEAADSAPDASDNAGSTAPLAGDAVAATQATVLPAAAPAAPAEETVLHASGMVSMTPSDLGPATLASPVPSGAVGVAGTPAR